MVCSIRGHSLELGPGHMSLRTQEPLSQAHSPMPSYSFLFTLSMTHGYLKPKQLANL